MIYDLYESPLTDAGCGGAGDVIEDHADEVDNRGG
jgi:hypothetical protein